MREGESEWEAGGVTEGGSKRRNRASGAQSGGGWARAWTTEHCSVRPAFWLWWVQRLT